MGSFRPGRPSRALLVVLGILLVGLIDWVDLRTGEEVALELFYALPVAVGAWYGGVRIGALLAAVAVLGWEHGDIVEDVVPWSAVHVWNVVVRLAFLMMVAVTTGRLAGVLAAERSHARTDPLTGTANRRAFHAHAAHVVRHMARTGRPLTVLYVDVDDFKQLNDERGHEAGDAALRAIGRVLLEHVRGTDVAARLGGDEFAALLAGVGEAEARVRVARIRARLREEMARQGWRVTFSMGVLVARVPPPDAESLVRLSDGLMYAVKRSGKDNVRFELYDALGEGVPALPQ